MKRNTAKQTGYVKAGRDSGIIRAIPGNFFDEGKETVYCKLVDSQRLQDGN